VDDWYPIHHWSISQVWTRIGTAGTRPHHAYRDGMSRLSCRFCVLASRSDLVCSARLNPELAQRHADIIAEANGTQAQLSLLPLADIA
jgi:3'-phosphoadenosine 5'-phosphosulfate sulfotransferase (PAPS reductase)/FAD synthetase